MAEGGRVPCAGESEPREENVKSPKPVLSSAIETSFCAPAMGERVCAAVTAGDDVFADDVLALPLAVRALFDVAETGVCSLFNAMDASSLAGRAPVIVNSASSIGFCVLDVCLFERVAFDLVTNPSLSSLTVPTVALAFLICLVVVFAGCLGLGFATRDVDDATLDLGGRGIVLSEHNGLLARKM